MMTGTVLTTGGQNQFSAGRQPMSGSISNTEIVVLSQYNKELKTNMDLRTKIML